MASILNHLRKYKTIILIGGLLFGVSGLVLLTVYHIHNNQYQWRPVKLSLPMQAGRQVSASFTAEVDQAYEIEIEFFQQIPMETLREFVLITDGPSPIDVNWKVINKNSVVAQGSCEDYLYIMKNADPMHHKILRKIMNIPYYQGLIWENTFARGVGKFTAKSGETYELQAEVETSIEELNPSNPVFSARINRAFTIRHFRSMIPLALAGFVLSGLSCVSLFLYALTVIIKTSTP